MGNTFCEIERKGIVTYKNRRQCVKYAPDKHGTQQKGETMKYADQISRDTDSYSPAIRRHQGGDLQFVWNADVTPATIDSILGLDRMAVRGRDGRTVLDVPADIAATEV